MGSFKGHALPGTFFIIMGIWWAIKCILKYACKKHKRTSYLGSKALFQRIEIFEGIVIIGMAITGEWTISVFCFLLLGIFIYKEEIKYQIKKLLKWIFIKKYLWTHILIVISIWYHLLEGDTSCLYKGLFLNESVIGINLPAYSRQISFIELVGTSEIILYHLLWKSKLCQKPFFQNDARIIKLSWENLSQRLLLLVRLYRGVRLKKTLLSTLILFVWFLNWKGKLGQMTSKAFHWL